MFRHFYRKTNNEHIMFRLFAFLFFLLNRTCWSRPFVGCYCWLVWENKTTPIWGQQIVLVAALHRVLHNEFATWSRNCSRLLWSLGIRWSCCVGFVVFSLLTWSSAAPKVVAARAQRFSGSKSARKGARPGRKPCCILVWPSLWKSFLQPKQKIFANCLLPLPQPMPHLTASEVCSVLGFGNSNWFALRAAKRDLGPKVIWSDRPSMGLLGLLTLKSSG